MTLDDKQIIKTVKFYLNKLITENDSTFIIDALSKSNFNIQKEDDSFIVKVKYQPKKNNSFIVDSTFSSDRIEISIKEKQTDQLKDIDITDSTLLKERYALYEVDNNEINLNYSQSYTYNITSKDNNTVILNPINTEEDIKLEFIDGEPNLLTNYPNIRIKRSKVLVKD